MATWIPIVSQWFIHDDTGLILDWPAILHPTLQGFAILGELILWSMICNSKHSTHVTGYANACLASSSCRVFADTVQIMQVPSHLFHSHVYFPPSIQLTKSYHLVPTTPLLVYNPASNAAGQLISRSRWLIDFGFSSEPHCRGLQTVTASLGSRLFVKSQDKFTQVCLKTLC